MFSTIFQSEDGLIGDDGMAARGYPEHWKGANGLYCAGMVRRGIYGSCEDAELIAGDISELLLRPKQQDQGDAAAAAAHTNGS
jgi:indole-3-pyruvate monooxygenase